MLGSIASGSIARLLVHPIDTVKARVQASTATVDAVRGVTAAVAGVDAPHAAGGASGGAANGGGAARRRGFAATFAAIARAEGARGLYRGLAIAFLGGVPGSALYFSA
jgi:hypothetical protein